MEKPFQLELFKFQQYKPDRIKKNKYRPKFFSFIQKHEKAILISIIFLIASLISFSLGVEKGKRLATVNKKERVITKQVQPNKIKTDQVFITENKVTRLETKKNISKYTIQVATFKTKTYAQKEVRRLKNKGLEASILAKGNYVYVYVGNFTEKQEARIALNQLKKTYHDCFIKRL